MIQFFRNLIAAMDEPVHQWRPSPIRVRAGDLGPNQMVWCDKKFPAFKEGRRRASRFRREFEKSKGLR